MKSYVKSFLYPSSSSGEYSKRKLFVMRESADSLDGFELSYLDEENSKNIINSFKDHEITDFSISEKLQDKTNYTKEWGSSWRRYSKSKIKELSNDE